jgi:aldose 1-epimerase
MRAPTGTQYTLELAGSTATVAELAASLRTLRIDGVDIVQPYAEGSATPFGSGIVLVPWPNRIPDGIWHLDGAKQQLDITEPAKNNAIHGLLRNAAYRLVGRTDESVTLGATVHPQHGYPFLLDTTVHYELTGHGIQVTHAITNHSDAAAPVAIGTHPFLQIGDVDTADLVLTVHAASRFEVDARLNPQGELAVENTDYDLRGGRRVGDLDLDDAFGEVTTVDGVSATLVAPDGRSVSLWQDENFPYVQVFTTPIFPRADGEGFTLAVAVEPMTAPADAFNSGQSLTWLAPGETWSATWGIQYAG